MNAYDSERPILLIGGKGKTGRRVAERLTARGVATRIASRSTQPAFDWNAPDGWAAALAGASAAYVTYYPDLAAPGAADSIGRFAEAAVNAGVRRIVLLSGRGEPEAQRAEAALQASGADWTILRCSWFSLNFSENFMLDSILAGVVALPVGAVREPFVDADDIADAAAAALTEDGHVGKLYELTGPRLLSFAEAVAEIAEASGRKLRYERIGEGEFHAMLVANGLPEDVVALVMVLFTEVLDGRNQSLADGVAQALGRPPKDFSDFARETAATDVWTPRRQRRTAGA